MIIITDSKDCVFCKIISGEIPSYKIFEDHTVIVFLDANPASKGHALIVPKTHFDNIYDLPEETFNHIASVIKKLSKAIKEKLNADGLNLINSNGKEAQQDVPHFHIHMIPRYKGDKIDIWNFKKPKNIDIEEVFASLK